MKYSVINGIRMVEVPAQDFRVILYDGKKKDMGTNRCNAGFFGGYAEGDAKFTLPVGHLVCDYAAESSWVRYYCKQRGQFKGEKFRFDSGSWPHQNPLYGKSQSTLVVAGGRASIQDLNHAPACEGYAIAGIPIMRHGEDVKFNTYVTGQGWDGSPLYGTWHIFVGIKEPAATTLYIMAMKTTSGNMILSAEAFKLFKALGFRDVIKLDGGGSCYLNVEGETTYTLENRRVCTILEFGPCGNPWQMSTRVLMRGSCGEAVKWLQWELTAHGYPCDIDGCFGPATEERLRAYQAANGLEVDGRCGPKTRASLLKHQ